MGTSIDVTSVHENVLAKMVRCCPPSLSPPSLPPSMTLGTNSWHELRGLPT
jgi:hypothetical protein